MLLQWDPEAGGGGFITLTPCVPDMGSDEFSRLLGFQIDQKAQNIKITQRFWYRIGI